MPQAGGNKRDALKRLQAIATIVSLVAVPIVVAIVGALIQTAVRESEARTKSMELAISILKEPPRQGVQPGLRAWAIETLQASSRIALSETARKELETKPLFPVQPVQRNLKRGGWSYLEIEKEAEVLDHKVTLKRIDSDGIAATIDGIAKSLYVNDSLVLPPDECVLHLLGFGYTRTDNEIAAGRSDPSQINSAFVAYVCP